MKRHPFLFVNVCLAAWLGVTACSSDDDPNAGRICNAPSDPPASFDPATPTVSYARDVVPIFTQSCATTDCHASSTVPLDMGTDANSIHLAIVNKSSTKLTTMLYVKPNDATSSFLMRKIDATHCALDSQCTNGSCGDSMPNTGALLSVEQRDTVRRWILQGAKKD